MKKSVRTLLTVVLVAVFLFSTGNYLLQQRDKAVGNSAYEQALQIAASGNQDSPKTPAATEAPAPEGEPRWVVAPVEEDDPHIKTLEAMDLAALREVNPDVVGWYSGSADTSSFPDRFPSPAGAESAEIRLLLKQLLQ